MNINCISFLYFFICLFIVNINVYSENIDEQNNKKVYIGDIVPQISWISNEDYKIIKELYIGMKHEEFISIAKGIGNLKSKYHRVSYEVNLPPEIYIKKYENNPEMPNINLVFRIDNNYVLNEIDLYFKVLYSLKINEYHNNIIDIIKSLLENLGEPSKCIHTVLYPEYKNERNSIVVMEWNINKVVKLFYSFSPIEDLQGNPLLMHIEISSNNVEYISKTIHKNIENKIEDTPFKTYIEEARKLVKESNKQ